MVYQSGRSTRRSHPCHHDHDGRDLEAETYDTQRMRLMIQIIVFLEILTSCFLRSEGMVELVGEPA